MTITPPLVEMNQSCIPLKFRISVQTPSLDSQNFTLTFFPLTLYSHQPQMSFVLLIMAIRKSKIESHSPFNLHFLKTKDVEHIFKCFSVTVFHISSTLC